FALTDANAFAVAEICAQLDGLPLAIELAAARVKLFPPQTLRMRLASRLKLLTAGPRDLPARQQTMRNTIDWSYQLLDTVAQRLFARLGVFVGGCSAEAVTAVCSAMGESEWDILEGLAALVDQSLLRQEAGLDGEPRFALLETIREYALEQLGVSGELEGTQRRHAAYYRTFAAAAEAGVEGAHQQQWMARLAQEQANLRAVLAWAAAQGDAELGLQLGSALWVLWDVQGTVTEGRAQLAALLAQAQTSPATTARIKVLRGAGLMAWDQGDVVVAETLIRESLTLARELGDQAALADALLFAGWITTRGDDTTTRSLLEESLALYRSLGNQPGEWDALNSLAFLSAKQGDAVAARVLGEQSLAIVQELGDTAGIVKVWHTLGEIARLQGEYQLARAHVEQSLALARAVNDSFWIETNCSALAFVRLHEGALDHATALFQESLVLSRQTERRSGTILCLVGLGGVAIARQQPERAARLLGAAAALLDATQVALDTIGRRDYDRLVARLQNQADQASVATAWAEGRALSIAQASAQALEPVAAVTPAASPQLMPEPGTPGGPTPAGLTAREVEVLRLVTQGLTDVQVAERLVVSAHTVHAHLRSIYAKLDVSSRAAATRIAVEHHLI
ncbi:MAG: LuxR family transcriptional regulator, partial [Chloroflexales bacterium]|nr:LuxR family transcriptional regulator [Chloroflexales bacterium]